MEQSSEHNSKQVSNHEKQLSNILLDLWGQPQFSLCSYIPGTDLGSDMVFYRLISAS